MTYPRPTELFALADRCEKATGRDVTLDAEIGYVVDARCEAGNVRYLHDVAGNSFEHIGSYGAGLPAYTVSLDAAISLVPKGCLWTMDSRSSAGWSAGIWKPMRNYWLVHQSRERQAATPALALTAAALRASAALKGDQSV